MTLDDCLHSTPLIALAAMAVIGLGRAIVMSRRGARVVAVDRRRTVGEMVCDGLLVVGFLLWGYLVIAEAGWLPRGFWPSWLWLRVVDLTAAQCLGAAMLLLGVALYGCGVVTLGQSWRLGIDREGAGPLVTSGVFTWSRNPVYLAFDLLFWGTFLVHGRVVELLLAVLMPLLLHATIRREERFLASQFGAQYEAYCRQVRRYF